MTRVGILYFARYALHFEVELISIVYFFWNMSSELYTFYSIQIIVIITIAYCFMLFEWHNSNMDNSFGEKLRKLLKKKRIKLSELSAAIDVSVSSIVRWENNDREPRMSDIKKIADALGVSSSYLLSETDDSARGGDAGAANVEQAVPDVEAAPQVITIENVDGKKITLPATPATYEFLKEIFAGWKNPGTDREREAVLELIEDMPQEEIKEIYDFISAKKSKVSGEKKID